MRTKTTLVVLILAAVFVAMTAAFGSMSSQRQQLPLKERQKLDESQFPIVDYTALEPTEPGERTRRQAKGRRFHKPIAITPNRNFATAATVYHWPEGFPPLPVAESDLIVIGEVLGAHAYLSTDKSDVYSEFTFRIDEILKNKNEAATLLQPSVVVTRSGGRVRFPAGEIQLVYNTGQGMPRIGRRYLVFLKCTDQDFDLLTGYEMRAGHIFPLDDGTPNFIAFENADETTFLADLREKIKRSK